MEGEDSSAIMFHGQYWNHELPQFWVYWESYFFCLKNTDIMKSLKNGTIKILKSDIYGSLLKQQTCYHRNITT